MPPRCMYPLETEGTHRRRPCARVRALSRGHLSRLRVLIAGDHAWTFKASLCGHSRPHCVAIPSLTVAILSLTVWPFQAPGQSTRQLRIYSSVHIEGITDDDACGCVDILQQLSSHDDIFWGGGPGEVCAMAADVPWTPTSVALVRGSAASKEVLSPLLAGGAKKHLGMGMQRCICF